IGCGRNLHKLVTSRVITRDSLPRIKSRDRARALLTSARRRLAHDEPSSNWSTQMVVACADCTCAVEALLRCSCRAAGLCLTAFRLATDQSHADRLGC